MPEYHVLEYPDWTVMLALDPDGKCILVEQYRHGIGRQSLEFPSGMLEPEENPQDGAIREFKEETGFAATNCTLIGSVSEDPSRHNNTAHAFFCADPVLIGAPTLEITEDLKQVRLTPREVQEAIRTGRMIHGLHIGAFYKAVSEGLFSIQ